MRVLFSALVLVSLTASCEPGILFTEPQPMGADAVSEFPASYRGDYWVDETKTSGKYSPPGPILSIRKDSLIFTEYRSKELHKNFVDGASYQLIDGHLYRDSIRISLMPAKLEGEYYHYIHKIDSLLFHLADEHLVFNMEDSLVSLKAQMRSGNNNLVLNLFPERQHRNNYWASYVFQKTATNKLEIRVSPAAKELSSKTMMLTYHAEFNETGKFYTVKPGSAAEFEKLVKAVFVTAMFLERR